MQFLFVAVFQKYLNLAAFFKDLLAIFVLWYVPHFNYETWTFALLFSVFTSKPCDKWVPVTMAWHIFRLQIQTGRLAANILNKLLQTAYNSL